MDTLGKIFALGGYILCRRSCNQILGAVEENHECANIRFRCEMDRISEVVDKKVRCFYRCFSLQLPTTKR